MLAKTNSRDSTLEADSRVCRGRHGLGTDGDGARRRRSDEAAAGDMALAEAEAVEAVVVVVGKLEKALNVQ